MHTLTHRAANPGMGHASGSDLRAIRADNGHHDHAVGHHDHAVGQHGRLPTERGLSIPAATTLR